MLDKSVPYYQVFMTKNEIEKFDKYELPEGFEFCYYKDGMTIDWVRLQMYYEFYSTFGDAINFFKNIYLSQGSMIYERLLFVKDKDNVIVATGSLWVGTHFGTVMHKIQGIAVHPEFRGKGLASAILTRLFEIAIEIDCRGGLYTNTNSWSYPAINLLFKNGFLAYMGPKPANCEQKDDGYTDTNKMAWEIVMRKIALYNAKKNQADNEKYGSL